MRSLPSFVGWGAWAVLTASMARGQPPSPDLPAAPDAGDSCVGDRFVVLKLAEDFDPELGAEVRTDLTTDLAHRGLGLCTEGSTSRAPASIVTLRAERSLVVIELDDLVTQKRVARDLSLQKIPANGRALAIAIAIDELLRASWAELTLERSWQPEPERESVTAHPTPPVGPQPTRARPRSALHVEVGAALGYAHTANEFDAFSLRGRALVRPWDFGWLEVDLGGLTSRPAGSPFGEAVASGLTSSLTLGGCSRTDAPLFGCAGARGGVDWLSVRGVRPSMASVRRERAVVTHASIVGMLAAPLTERMHLFGEFGLGSVLNGARATDGTRTIMDIAGLLLSLRVGVGVEL